MNTEPIGERYVRLALAIDQHLPGYIDAYFGPSGLEGAGQGPRAFGRLTSSCAGPQR